MVCAERSAWLFFIIVARWASQLERINVDSAISCGESHVAIGCHSTCSGLFIRSVYLLKAFDVGKIGWS